jgi:ABC-type phosphate transport system auxiliary subunit
MMAKWTPEIEQRYTELRLRQLSGNLTPAEEKELSKIRAIVAVVEAEITTPALQKLEAEQAALQNRLASLQAENSEMVQLLNQQALLIADTKRWLREFEQRYTAIQNSLTRLTEQSVAT